MDLLNNLVPRHLHGKKITDLCNVKQMTLLTCNQSPYFRYILPFLCLRRKSNLFFSLEKANGFGKHIDHCQVGSLAAPWLLVLHTCTERDCMPAHLKQSGQAKINVHGEEELPLLLLKKQRCSEGSSVRLLFAFIHYKGCYNQHRHEMPLVFHVCRVLPSPCVQLPHTQFPLQIIPRTSSQHPITSLHFESMWCCNTVPDSNWTSFGPKASMKNH